jgi:hypothetical protein
MSDDKLDRALFYTAKRDEISENQLNEITGYAELLMQPAEIAVIVGIDEDMFLMEMQIVGAPLRIAFYKGYLKTKAELQKAVIAAARQHSSPAQLAALKIAEQVDLNILKG